MAKKQNIILAAGIIVAIVAGLAIGIGAYYLGLGNPQTGSQDTYVPKLTASLLCSDNRSDTNAPFLHVTGTIQNTGNSTANNVTMHVYASQAGNSSAIDTTVTLDPMEAGAIMAVNKAFNYTGQALEAFSEPTIDWTN
jgi:tetrahydromethanopterin S-methyltransferase subunit F